MVDKAGQGSVLIVDDDEDCRVIYSTALVHHGFKVHLAEDGEAGVRVACAEHPDLILMDLGLPKLDGTTAMHRIREEPTCTNTPVVALTARASFHDRAELLEAGFDRVLFKPITPGRVVAAVRDILKEQR